MEQDKIDVGSDYVYLAPSLPIHQPLRAVPNGEPEGGYVDVTLYHPDTGQSVVRVKTRELAGRWDDEPERRFTQYASARTAAKENDQTLTWKMIADQRYDQVRRQRALAGRLTSRGIVRASRHYAGAGGTTSRPHDADLQLNYDEIELLLDLAERGTSAMSVPGSVPLLPDETSST